MAISITQTEKQYLTSDSDMVDRICYDYYGTLDGTVEAVYQRNYWLTQYPLILPTGLIITLPVVSLTAARASQQLWDYGTTKSAAGVVTAKKTSATELANALAALSAYRAQRSVSSILADASTTPGSGSGSSSNVNDPGEVTSADWVAVYYRDSSGNWKQARISKDNLNIKTDITGLTARVKTLEESLQQWNLMQFVPEGAASLQIQDGIVRMVLDRSKFQMTDQELTTRLAPLFPQFTLETCGGNVQVIGPINRSSV